MDTTADGLDAGGWGFPDARPGVVAFTDLMTAALEAVMIDRLLRRIRQLSGL
jgi:hypothetical protein